MEDIIKILTEQNARITGRKRTVLSPLLWLLGIIIPATLCAFHFDFFMLEIILSIMLGILFLTIIIGFFYCLIKKPDYLQSEKFRLEKRRLDIEAKKNNKKLEPVAESEVLDEKQTE